MTTALATRTSTAPAATLTCSYCGADCSGGAHCAAPAGMTAAGYPICYACAGRLEREAFDLNPARWSGYIVAGENGSDWDHGRRPSHVLGTLYRCWQGATVATWTGEPIADVILVKPTRRRTAEWAGSCIYSVKMRNPRTGATYRGLTYGPGMYVSMTLTSAGGRTK